MNSELPDLLARITPELCTYLGQILPKTGHNWWQERVFGRLTPSQQRFIEKKGIVSLEELDLAALLRILDQNWQLVSDIEDLGHEHRNYIKEMQTIRNR